MTGDRLNGNQHCTVGFYCSQDELKLPTSEATSGFPDHPHRGFETCSIMLKGKMEHRDHIGNHVSVLQTSHGWHLCPIG